VKCGYRSAVLAGESPKPKSGRPCVPHRVALLADRTGAEGFAFELLPYGVLESSALPLCTGALSILAYIHSPYTGVRFTRCVAK
jgi:hypothetical protein